MAEVLLTNLGSRDTAKNIVFLGGGRITAALIAGLRLGNYERPIIVYDRHPEKLRDLKRKNHVLIERDLADAVARARMLIIAVRPRDLGGLLDEVASCARGAESMLVVSLAAGIPLKQLRSTLGSRVRWARAMPSPVCRVARGLTAIAFDRNVSSDQRKEICEFFGRVGQVVKIPEIRFDAFTAAYSPSHGYHALATLATAAKRAGLDRKVALAAAAHALADGILYWRGSNLMLDELLREAATPRGTAAAAMAAMNRAGYEKVVAEGVRAGMNQARANARGLNTK
jgi:pyrroline-5-carboxylate reductase